MDYLPFETYLASSVFDVEAFLAGGNDDSSKNPLLPFPDPGNLAQPSPTSISRIMADLAPDPHSSL